MATGASSDTNWLCRLNETYAIGRAEGLRDPVALHDHGGRVLLFAGVDREPTASAILRVDDGLPRRWRRRPIPGSWLVVRRSHGKRFQYTCVVVEALHSPEWVHQAYGMLTAGSALLVHLAAEVRARVDEAGQVAMAEQLRACGFAFVGTDPQTSRALHAAASTPYILAVHDPGSGAVALATADTLHVWDTTFVHLEETWGGQRFTVEVPKGLSGSFHGGMNDLTRPCQSKRPARSFQTKNNAKN
jgi:hypothetical protein